MKGNNIKYKNPKDEFPLAIRFYQDGKIEEAKDILEKLVQKNPKDVDSLIFLGGIHLSTGQFQSAVDYYEKAVMHAPQNPTAFYNLGLSYHRLNQLDEAKNSYEKALEIHPNNIDALNNLGIIYSSQNKKEEALSYYNSALGYKKNNPQTLNNMGNLYASMGNFSEAEKYYEKAISIDQTNATYLFNLADSYFKQKKYNDSIVTLEKAIKIKPDYHQAYNSMGAAYLESNLPEKAIHLFEAAIKIKNDFWEAYQNLGSCYEKMNLHSEAISLYNKVLELSKGNINAVIKLSNLHMEKGNYGESENLLKNIGDDEKSKIVEYTNIGVAKLKQGKIDEAIEYSSKALETEYENALTHYNLAHALLLNGNFEQGWREYEWRKKRSDFEKRNFSKPYLEDQDIRGKKILVYDEQGLGDSIQFVRYIPMLKNLGAHVILEVSPRLAGLFKNINGVDELIIKNGTAEPNIDYDYHIALLSLPLYFKTDLKNIPCAVPYIFSDKIYSGKWNSLINNSNTLKVGISWAGNPKNYNDINRSCRLTELKDLFNVPGVKFYSLQKGEAVKQIYELGGDKIVDLDEQMDSMDTTAAAIEKLDLVISVDTSIAHLSGALGKPVWVMLPFLPDWRWMLNRDDSPWYPNVKLFRQKKEKDWSHVVAEIKKELLKLAGQANYVSQSENTNEESNHRQQMFLALSKGENFGWGVCSNYLRKELGKKIKVIDAGDLSASTQINGDLFHALTNLSFDSITELRGTRNFGYTFFENELNDKSVENSKKYDLIFGGSSWCNEKMEAKGIKNTGLLIQGIDPELFYPTPTVRNDKLFIIFSGGKFELRKGQDLVLKAFQILHKKYPDIILINAWFNYWNESIATMKNSSHINFNPRGNNWNEFISSILIDNDIAVNRVFTLPITPNEKLSEIYSKTDIGLFPNRCEGGTNLVLMEYMACGKPVVASFNSGHKDILTDGNSIRLKQMNEYKLYSNDKLSADWEEPSLDEIISSIEFAYHNRDKIKTIGNEAGNFMKQFTWEKTADSLLTQIHNL